MKVKNQEGQGPLWVVVPLMMMILHYIVRTVEEPHLLIIHDLSFECNHEEPLLQNPV
jgi:hypothetical protein